MSDELPSIVAGQGASLHVVPRGRLDSEMFVVPVAAGAVMPLEVHRDLRYASPSIWTRFEVLAPSEHRVVKYSYGTERCSGRDVAPGATRVGR